MENKHQFLRVFKNSKPIIGMIHLKGHSDKQVYEKAIKEIDILLDTGVDAVMIENYFGTLSQVEKVLDYTSKNLSESIYGLNALGNNAESFRLAREYNAKFIQFDSVSGHLPPEKDKKFHECFLEEREKCNAVILGGVRFKYQPHLSGRSLQEDLKIGMERSDAIGVTGSATGVETDMEKIHSFREIIGDFPLIVCAGMTPANCTAQLQIADGGVVGSYFKDYHMDRGDVYYPHVVEFMNIVSNLRKSLPQRVR